MQLSHTMSHYIVSTKFQDNFKNFIKMLGSAGTHCGDTYVKYTVTAGNICLNILSNHEMTTNHYFATYCIRSLAPVMIKPKHMFNGDDKMPETRSKVHDHRLFVRWPLIFSLQFQCEDELIIHSHHNGKCQFRITYFIIEWSGIPTFALNPNTPLE